jgi:hypothetical protein
MTRDGLNDLLDEVVKQLDEIKAKEEEELNNLDNEDEFVYIKFEDKKDELHIENPAPGL